MSPRGVRGTAFELSPIALHFSPHDTVAPPPAHNFWLTVAQFTQAEQLKVYNKSQLQQKQAEEQAVIDADRREIAELQVGVAVAAQAAILHGADERDSRWGGAAQRPSNRCPA